MQRAESVAPTTQPIPLSMIFLAALAVHSPLLLMKLPLKSYDANFHIFFASHYLHHWFDPWNPKWYAGFSQTTYPPLPQQWLALVSRVIGLDMAYMVVQFVAILLLALGVYRFSLLWVNRRAASFAALASVFLGSECFLVYSAGQLSTTFAAPLYLNALPYLYSWVRHGNWRSFIKGGSALRGGRRRPPRYAALRIVSVRDSGARVGIYRSREGERVSVSAFVLRTGSIVLLVGAAIGSGASAVLDCADSLSRHADSHSSSQSRELHTESAVGIELLHGSLRSFDSCSAVHLSAGRFVARLRPLLLGFWLAFLVGLVAQLRGPDGVRPRL